MPHSAKHVKALAVARFEKTLAAFEQAHEDYCFRGSKFPEEIPYIELEYQKRRANLTSAYRKALDRNIGPSRGDDVIDEMMASMRKTQG